MILYSIFMSGRGRVPWSTYDPNTLKMMYAWTMADESFHRYDYRSTLVII